MDGFLFWGTKENCDYHIEHTHLDCHVQPRTTTDNHNCDLLTCNECSHSFDFDAFGVIPHLEQDIWKKEAMRKA